MPKLHYVKIDYNTPKFEKITKDRAAKFVDMLSAIENGFEYLQTK